MSDWIDDETYRSMVEQMPIPSVDLLMDCEDGVLLGYRENRPAKDTWFVPGGRVQKGEELDDAVHRIAQEETGTNVEIVNQLGAYSLKYPDSEFEYMPKHYVATAYVVRPEDETFTPDDQNAELDVFDELPPETHWHTQRYIADALDQGYLQG